MKSLVNRVLFTLFGFICGHYIRFRKVSALIQSLNTLRAKLQQETTNRQSERLGRIKAEQTLRKLQSDKCQPQESVHDAVSLKPIGFVRSCFSKRNGTPRQPLLVPLARAKIDLCNHVPDSALEGLSQYSHCWVLYIFHENTDGGSTNIKGKIRVPRLNGLKVGVLATRSPHRPNPVGLTVAQVINVDKRRIILGGADIVDGSPVLDIKPYVPFCDSVHSAYSPAWVQAECEQEPLNIAQLTLSDTFKAELTQCWSEGRKDPLYLNHEDFVQFVQQVLSRDIRSVHQRLNSPGSSDGMLTDGNEPTKTVYHVILDGIDVSYVVSRDCRVTITGAAHNSD